MMKYQQGLTLPILLGFGLLGAGYSATFAAESVPLATDSRLMTTPGNGNYTQETGTGTCVPEITCADIKTQAAAQILLEQFFNDPFHLDANKDGVACSEENRSTVCLPKPVCGFFKTQAEAQRVLNALEQDFLGLDADRDGIACDEIFPNGATQAQAAHSCQTLHTDYPGLASGVYWIDPNGTDTADAFQVYCDQTTDEGGWVLAAKLHRNHGSVAYDEVPTWFGSIRDTDTLLDTVSYEDRLPGQASQGSRLGTAYTKARFTLIAEDDVNQKAIWYKAVDAGIWSWFSTTDHPKTQVCTDLNMTKNCSSGRIFSNSNGTNLDGMTLAHYGYQVACSNLAMRQNGAGYSHFDAICSCTGTSNPNNNAWHDDAFDGHWGNGLEIWLR